MSNESLSSAFGWVSIACWFVVYSPQVVENYQLQSGEGLSIAFVLIWLAGDLCNFFGAVLAKLQTTVALLAVYYTLCDLTLLAQIYYYRWKRHWTTSLPSRSPPPPQVILHTENGEREPLLGSPPIPTLPNAQSVVPFPSLDSPNANTKPSESQGKEDEESIWRDVLRYLVALGFVIGVGLVAWVIGGRGGPGEGEGDGEGRGGEKDLLEWKSQFIGWTSAVLYLGSRIPQILKNLKTRCEGLSLALFLFAIAGNVTYVLSICTESMEVRHLVANASWLAGSGLTVFLDVFVLCQFFYFRRVDGGYGRMSGSEP